MNREILFRGKDIRGIWHIGLLARIGDAWYISNRAGIATAFEVIPETIGWYTGLTDKNGNKIFEGDILRVPYRPQDDCIVAWHDGSFRLRWENKERRAEYGNEYNAAVVRRRS